MKKNQSYKESEVLRIYAERDFYRKLIENIPARISLLNATSVPLWSNRKEETEKENQSTKYNLSDLLLNFNAFESWPCPNSKEIQNNLDSTIIKELDSSGTELTFLRFSVVLDNSSTQNPLHQIQIDFEISPNMRNPVFWKRLSDKKAENQYTGKLKQPTETEKSVIRLLCKGYTIRQTAQILNRSKHTIDNHKRNIFKKLGINKTRHLTVLAHEMGIYPG
jgi:DNA-binding CsgD family transcriptional regulator